MWRTAPRDREKRGSIPLAAFPTIVSGTYGTLLFLVAQRSAAGLVDKMHPGAGWAGYDLVTIRLNSRRVVRQPNLNVQSGSGTPKIELGHFLILIRPSRSALTCLKVVSS
jgi:hypothetical protein